MIRCLATLAVVLLAALPARASDAEVQASAMEAASAEGCAPASVNPLPRRTARDPLLFQITCATAFDALALQGTGNRAQSFAIVECRDGACWLASMTVR